MGETNLQTVTTNSGVERVMVETGTVKLNAAPGTSRPEAGYPRRSVVKEGGQTEMYVTGISGYVVIEKITTGQGGSQHWEIHKLFCNRNDPSKKPCSFEFEKDGLYHDMMVTCRAEGTVYHHPYIDAPNESYCLDRDCRCYAVLYYLGATIPNNKTYKKETK